MAWIRLYQYRTPIDPDYPGPTSTINLWRDSLGGLMLGMDSRDGEKVLIMPISEDDAHDLADALRGARG